MGGRGSLSSGAHTMYDTASIKKVMNSNGIRVHGLNNVTRKGLSVVVEALEGVLEMNKAHNSKLVTNIVIGVNRNADFAYNPNFKVVQKGKEIRLGPTLIIPKKTVQYGKADLERELKYATKNKIVVGRTVKELVYHEMGHALHMKLKQHDPKAYAELDRKINLLTSNAGYRTNLSVYAGSKRYGGKVRSYEYVAEAIVHLQRNTKTRLGQDMIDLVHDYISRVPGVEFSRYGVKTPKTTRRAKKNKLVKQPKRIKRKPKR